MEADNPESKVKVVDRRWFTSEGELREPDGPPPRPFVDDVPPAVEPGPIGPPEPLAEQPPVAPPVRLPAQVFQDVVDFLANYAVVFLTGQVPELGRDPAAGRLFVDLLTEVQRRTQAQLSMQEAKVLDDVLFQLRTRFLATAR